MKKNLNPFHVIDIPSGRREMPNLLDLYWGKHSIYGLLEVDVTVARQFIANHKAETGETLSFTGYLAYCVARAVDEDKSVQAYLKGRKQLAVFDDVDVAMPVERQIGGSRAQWFTSFGAEPQDLPRDPPGDPHGAGPASTSQ